MCGGIDCMEVWNNCHNHCHEYMKNEWSHISDTS